MESWQVVHAQLRGVLGRGDISLVGLKMNGRLCGLNGDGST
jgi:hypothetical protein